MSQLIYKKDKTIEDIEELLADNRRLVYYMLTKSNQLGNQDAESAAWEALWDAINLFDIYSTTAFSTYACTLIKNKVYDVLRKQKRESSHVCSIECIGEVAELCYEIEQEEDNAMLKLIEQQFKLFVDSKRGVIRDVLLAWHSSGFRATANNLAKMCNTSESYVGRVQCSFRAFLSCKVKRK